METPNGDVNLFKATIGFDFAGVGVSHKWIVSTA